LLSINILSGLRRQLVEDVGSKDFNAIARNLVMVVAKLIRKHFDCGFLAIASDLHELASAFLLHQSTLGTSASTEDIGRHVAKRWLIVGKGKVGTTLPAATCIQASGCRCRRQNLDQISETGEIH
jgi:hypothetical protein